MSNFPKYVAIYRPAENGYQVLFIDGGKFQVLTSNVSDGIWYNVGKSKEYPQDDCFQIVRPADKEVYYWPTGFDLVRNVPKSWPKGPVVRYPIFQFLTPPVGLSHTVIPAVASGEMNAEWAAAMKVIRSAALLEHREFKDMPSLISEAQIALAASPVILPSMPALEDDTMPLKVSEGTYWASLDILLNSAKSIWWLGWREVGPFRKRVRILNLDMLEPIEFLHYLRLVSSINHRTDSSGGNKIALKFSAEEVEKMRDVKTDVAVRDEIVSIMSQYIS
jgi:hypothetical protein